MNVFLNNPTVGSKGLWELKAPFNSLLPVNTALECTAISNYGQLIAIGIDPYETYYKKHEIPEATYREHMETEGRIVFLRTDSGQRYSFPLHYLVSYPYWHRCELCEYGYWYSFRCYAIKY